jgi:hypothetical protein
MPKMVSLVEPNPEELVKAFRDAARKLGCDKSEQRFQEALFAIGTQEVVDAHKPAGPSLKRRSRIAWRAIT